MNINPRLLLNKQTGKLFKDVFIPRPLQDIEKELFFDIESITFLSEVQASLKKLANLITSFQEYYPLFIKREAYFSLILSKIQIDPYHLYINRTKILELDGILEALEFVSKNEDKYDFLELNMLINKMLVHNQDKHPGQFRNTLILKNTAILPVPPKKIKLTLLKLADFLEESSLPALIKLALLYYQYLMISPFLDANHRQVRLLLMKYFNKYNILNDYLFAFSKYLIRYKSDCQKAIIEVRTQGNYLNWIIFFLRLVDKTIKEQISLLEELAKINKESSDIIYASNETRKTKSNLIEILNYLAIYPITDIKDTAHYFDKTYPTIASYFEILANLGIIYPLNQFRRNRLFVYDRIFKTIFE